MSPTSAIAAPPVHELFYDPSRLAYDEGNWISPIGGHSDHVHVSFGTPGAALAIIAKAQAMGLRATENPYVGSVAPGVHTATSYHYKNFPGLYGVPGRTLGEAIDVSGSPDLMASFAAWVKQTYLTGSPPLDPTSGAAFTASTSTETNDNTPFPGSGTASGAGCATALVATAGLVSAPIILLVAALAHGL